MKNKVVIIFIFFALPLVCLSTSDENIKPANEANISSKLLISPNGRFLQYEDGKPFFYLGDTAWELFHRLNREDAERYLIDRADKGFTVIQAVAVAELDGHIDPNPYGHIPFIDNDPAKPALKEGNDNDYWDHVDFIIDKANSYGLYLGFLPTWGKYWHDSEALFTPENAAKYGEWLGNRYQDKGIIWILGGDRTIKNELHRDIIISMANGIRKGDDGKNLITFHPRAGEASSEFFHSEDWLDFNMNQGGHLAEFFGLYGGNRINEKVKDFNQFRVDYNLTPVKPVINGEPLYEDHPLSFNAKKYGYSTAADVRRHLYWSLFLGAFGHTYGHHSIWQMWTKEKKPVNNPVMTWDEALAQPGANQMQFGRRLIESRPFFSRIPNDSILVPHRVPEYIPGAGRYKFVATSDTEKTFAMVYAPISRPFNVDMSFIDGENIKAWWYNPRNGEAVEIGHFKNGVYEFIPPNQGELLDWILVLDDVEKNYPAPGTAVSTKK